MSPLINSQDSKIIGHEIGLWFLDCSLWWAYLASGWPCFLEKIGGNQWSMSALGNHRGVDWYIFGAWLVGLPSIHQTQPILRSANEGWPRRPRNRLSPSCVGRAEPSDLRNPAERRTRLRWKSRDPWCSRGLQAHRSRPIPLLNDRGETTGGGGNSEERTGSEATQLDL